MVRANPSFHKSEIRRYDMVALFVDRGSFYPFSEFDGEREDGLCDQSIAGELNVKESRLRKGVVGRVIRYVSVSLQCVRQPARAHGTAHIATPHHCIAKPWSASGLKPHIPTVFSGKHRNEQELKTFSQFSRVHGGSSNYLYLFSFSCFQRHRSGLPSAHPQRHAFVRHGFWRRGVHCHDGHGRVQR